MKRFVTPIHILAVTVAMAIACADADDPKLRWDELPPLPDTVGVAGPFVGIHQDELIVAGGANFPLPVWETDKVWHNTIHVLSRNEQGVYRWRDGGKLPRPLAYGAAVSTEYGVLCLGGNDSRQTYADAFLLAREPATDQLQITELPPLPAPRAFGSATIVDGRAYFVAGQSGSGLDTASRDLWSLDLQQLRRWVKVTSEGATAIDASPPEWQIHDPIPGPTRAFHLTAAQHNGYHDSLYVISGRRQNGDETEFLRDVWEFAPATQQWRQRREVPRCVMAGTAIGYGQSHLLILGGADGSLFTRSDELRDRHPGFPKQALAYHTITDTWVAAGEMPANHVTTVATRWDDSVIVASGEVRPRVRSPKVWKITPVETTPDFGTVNYIVLFLYLGAMVGVGVYFTGKNKDTDDYFRGGKQIPWWAAGCSIFATMLSSLTYTGVPSKSYAQDWVYSVGNMMIPVVAVVAVFVALPFYRRIDATSAYEYLEKRFNRATRLFGSASFTLFHLFRMAVVMSLTGMALAVATPLTPAQSVLLMGALSIIYCTMGGIEAVIWTDTIQTVVLLGGALVAVGLLISGIDGGTGGLFSAAAHEDKFRMANWHWDPANSQVALWAIVIGGIGQNLSSYTADQAVVQRYMTTSSQQRAARSIWTNAFLTIPATILFFLIGTALFAFYRSHPERLELTMTTDQVFPLFIAREMPLGVAGLIVAGVFAAAQSTVSTSMNSTATAIVTDFLRPWNRCESERGYLRAARLLTFLLGAVGTMLGLLFVDNSIKSLFDQFLVVIGLFMGVLGGLFVLGALTRRANGPGALTGALVGAAVMFLLWRYQWVNGYLFTAAGITTCFAVGYLSSRVLPAEPKDLAGLTVFTALPKNV